MCRIDTELVINAPPSAVWAVFGDFANWGSWNDFMVLPVPPTKPGRHCRVLFHLDGGCVRHSTHDPEVRGCAVRRCQQHCHGSVAQRVRGWQA